MNERFFPADQFARKFTEEVLLAADIYKRMLDSGFEEYAYAVLDAYFISGQQEKIKKLGDFFTQYYQAKVTAVAEKGDGWELTVAFPQFPLNEDNLLCWAIDLLLKGYEHDCMLDGYGTDAGTGNYEFSDEDNSRLPWYFDEALKAYHHRNFSAAIIYFSSAIRIFPENPNAWYSRGIARDAIFLRAKALEDYNRAIELAPSFVEAYINRGVNKNLSASYAAALEDFRKAVDLDGNNATAYFNMGNTHHSMGNLADACAAWKKAQELGAEYAAEQLALHCK
ncbi:tetratricopeptide repeat protein [Chitinophaga alhagiae]|uniref:tetratricopeptide repeat protein n=1 Tax=Chitinophaga alhagiae TaxID=2203219 RepID=UPI001300B6A0|nr:tetratricopeptide repeat protein [Chitinophaga alhagiae]